MTHAAASAAARPVDERDARQIRWEAEARFFDRAARSVNERGLRIDPLVLDRYRGPRLRRRFNKEFRFRILGPLAGKTVLDVGCGDGLNAVLFAKMGARVTGIDVSPGAVELARRRADVNGVSERTTFLCTPIETAELPADSFDIVWGDEILHHVVEELDLVLRRVACWAKRGGVLMFAEPVNLAAPLRRLRSALPVRARAASAERPLVRRELELLRRYVPDLRRRPYCLFARLVPFLLGGRSYERSSPLHRAMVNAIDSVDYFLLSLPLGERLGGVGVMYGHPLKATAPDAAGG